MSALVQVSWAGLNVVVQRVLRPGRLSRFAGLGTHGALVLTCGNDSTDRWAELALRGDPAGALRADCSGQRFVAAKFTEVVGQLRTRRFTVLVDVGQRWECWPDPQEPGLAESGQYDQLRTVCGPGRLRAESGQRRAEILARWHQKSGSRSSAPRLVW
jgi:hypothetical protein